MMRVFFGIGWVANTPQPWILERRFSIIRRELPNAMSATIAKIARRQLANHGHIIQF
jgi:hypothetical protein